MYLNVSKFYILLLFYLFYLTHYLSDFLFAWFWLKLVQNYIFLSKPLTRKKAILKGKGFAFLLGHRRLVRTKKYFNFADTPYRQEPSKRE